MHPLAFYPQTPRRWMIVNGAGGTVYLVRHGETAWTLTGQHTGRTDLPLTPHGERQARALAARLQGLRFDEVLCSPLQRALRTCQLAGFGRGARLEPELLEWDYGEYEGLKLPEIHGQRPGWELFRDGCPGGESPARITERADRVVSRLRNLEGHALVFSSGHILRVLAARWLAFSAEMARYLGLDPAGVCVLGYDHGGADRVIRLWNDTRREG